MVQVEWQHLSYFLPTDDFFFSSCQLTTDDCQLFLPANFFFPMPALKYIPNYTIDDYRQWEGDWELWDGIPVAMSPSPFGRHQWSSVSIAASIKQQLDAQSCDDCFVLMETDWIIGDRTVVRPDIAVCCGEFPERFIESAPTLIVEVLSDSTAEKDRHSKRALYESQGVQQYLILDTTAERFQVERLVDGNYVEQPNNEPLSIRLHDDCQLELRVPRRKARKKTTDK